MPIQWDPENHGTEAERLAWATREFYLRVGVGLGLMLLAGWLTGVSAL